MSKLYNTAKKAFFEPIKKALKKETNIGKRITNIPANVPQDRLSKATRDLKLAVAKRKGSEAKLKQTQFEIDQANKGKGSYDFTFDPLKANVKKESVKKRNEESKKMFRKAQGKAKGGRVGLKRGTGLTSKKSNIQKIKETFGSRGMAKNKKASKFGMLSVKAGIDKNPNPTQADRIAGAKMKNKKRFV